MQYIYLHGFASSPNSLKAKFFVPKFSKCGYNLITPDFNQPDFVNLCLSRQIQQVEPLCQTQATTLIGSSFGGLTALWLAQRQPMVKRLILLAPAVDFLNNCLAKKADFKAWQQQQYIKIYHYAKQSEQALSYQFASDLQHYPDIQLQRQIPTLIFHGKNDGTIPIELCQTFVKTRPWITMATLDSDHRLNNCLDQIWEQISDFCSLT